MDLLIGGHRCTTVGELIEHLKRFPEGVPVIYMCCSDFSPLQLDEVKLETKEGKRLVYRGGQVVTTYPNYEWGTEVPVYVEAVTFPGN